MRTLRADQGVDFHIKRRKYNSSCYNKTLIINHKCETKTVSEDKPFALVLYYLKLNKKGIMICSIYPLNIF